MPKRSTPVEIAAVFVVVCLITAMIVVLLQTRSNSAAPSVAQVPATTVAVPTARPATAIPQALPVTPPPQDSPSPTPASPSATPTPTRAATATSVATATQELMLSQVKPTPDALQGVWKLTSAKTGSDSEPHPPAFSLQMDLHSDGTVEFKMLDRSLGGKQAKEVVEQGRYDRSGGRITFSMGEPSVILSSMFGTVQIAFPNRYATTPGVPTATPALILPPPLQTLSCAIETSDKTLTLSSKDIHLIFTH